MVANPLTAADLRRIADDMADGDVVLADIWIGRTPANTSCPT